MDHEVAPDERLLQLRGPGEALAAALGITEGDAREQLAKVMILAAAKERRSTRAYGRLLEKHEGELAAAAEPAAHKCALAGRIRC